uniref:Uncharacterized protein n=1 Tax=Heterorhabditis bacteriophora TaxID=37862 RepID=A0A1I7WKY6_HETBA
MKYFIYKRLKNTKNTAVHLCVSQIKPIFSVSLLASKRLMRPQSMVDHFLTVNRIEHEVK